VYNYNGRILHRVGDLCDHWNRVAEFEVEKSEAITDFTRKCVELYFDG
jgi:hypothetical protein